MSASWHHTDPRGPLIKAVMEAFGRAARREWNADPSGISSASRVADLRAVLLATAFVSMRLSITRETMSSDDGTMTIPIDDQYSNDERRNAAGALWATWTLLSGNVAPTSAHITTSGDSAATEEAGNPIMAAVAIVVGAVAAVGVAVYVAQKTAEIIDRQLARNEATQRLIASQASALRVLAIHAKQEEAAKRELPLTEAERTELQNLQSIQKEIAGKKDGALPSAIPSGSEVTQSLSFGAVALGVAAAWLLFGNKG